MAKIAFIQEELRDRFGVMLLSACLGKHGHVRDVFVAEKTKDLVGDVKAFAPDILAFSTMSAGINFALETMRKLKAATGAITLMGGPHATFYPEIIKEEGVDAVCIGEGEGAIVDLAEAIDKKGEIYGIKNLWIKDRENPETIYKNELRDRSDINELPIFDRDLYFNKYQELADAPTKKIFIAKGCPFDCSYCFNHSLKQMYKGKGKYLQFYTVDRVLDEIRQINEKWGMEWLQIITDTVNVDREWFMEFMKRYKEEFDIKYICNVRIDHIDEEIVKMMKDSGCDRVNYGIEHGNYEIRKNVLKRDMSDEDIIKGGQLFNKYGMRVQTANIIGVPHETVETAMSTVWLNRKVKPDIAQIFILQPYPKTQIYEYSREHHFLDDDYAFSVSGTGFQLSFNGSEDRMQLKLEDEKKLVRIFYLFNFLVQHPWTDKVYKILLSLPLLRLYKAIYMYPVAAQHIKYSKSLSEKLSVLKKFFYNILKG